MRSLDIFHLFEARQELTEVKMSPSNLKQLSDKVHGALVGFEFEMIVPDMAEDDEDYGEPNYDYDESANNISDIVAFFEQEGRNDPSVTNRLESELKDGFVEFLPEYFRDNELPYFRGYIYNNVSPETVAKELGLDADEDPSRSDYDDFMDQEWQQQGKYYIEALQHFIENSDKFALEKKYLKDLHIYTMADVPDHFLHLALDWPFYSTSVTRQLEDLGKTFGRFVGMPVNVSDTYHGARRSNDAYSLEIDTSINPDDTDEAGLEFISPPLPLDEAISQLGKVKAFAKAVGAYTNRSTGLHINVSVPNYDINELDYVKLAILLGDKYVLKQFNRYGNSYAKSAIDIIKKKAISEPEKVNNLISQLKNNTDTIASKVLHSGRTDKMTSINTKNDRVEFRSPGDDWLNEHFELIADTTRRFVVALDAACDKTKYREEYLKGFSKLLAENDEDTKEMSAFARYMAGIITREEYANILEGKRFSKYQESGLEIINPDRAEENDWEVAYQGAYGSRVLWIRNTADVHTKEQVLDILKKVNPHWFKREHKIAVRQIVYEGIDDYQLYSMSQFDTVLAKNPEDAIHTLYLLDPKYFDKHPNILKEITPELVKTDNSYYYNSIDSPRKILHKRLNLQKQKIARNKEYLDSYKLWKFSTFNNAFEYLVAKTYDEAVDTLMKMYPRLQAIDVYGKVDEYPLDDRTVKSYLEFQDEKINDNATSDIKQFGRPRATLDYNQLHLYRVVNQANFQTTYIVAKNHTDALSIAKKIYPEMFSVNRSVITVDKYLFPDRAMKVNVYDRQLRLMQQHQAPNISDILNKVYLVRNKNTGDILYVVADSADKARDLAIETFSSVPSATNNESDLEMRILDL